MTDKAAGSKVAKLCKRLESSEFLPEYCAFHDLLIRQPISDYLLRCIFFDKGFEKNTMEIKAVFLPLYVSLPAFSLQYAQALRSPEDVRAGKWHTDWHLNDEESMVQAIRTEANSFFARATTASDFAKVATKLTELPNDDHVALSWAQGGELLKARIALELLSSRYWLQQNKLGYEGLKDVKIAVRKGSEDTKQVLRKIVNGNIELLQLAGIEKFFNS